MKKMTKIQINLYPIVLIAIALWVGITGRVDWWIIMLISISHLDYREFYREKKVD